MVVGFLKDDLCGPEAKRGIAEEEKVGAATCLSTIHVHDVVGSGSLDQCSQTLPF